MVQPRRELLAGRSAWTAGLVLLTLSLLTSCRSAAPAGGALPAGGDGFGPTPDPRFSLYEQHPAGHLKSAGSPAASGLRTAEVGDSHTQPPLQWLPVSGQTRMFGSYQDSRGR